MRGLLVRGLALSLSLLVVVACTTSYPPCYRGEYRGCTCEGAPPPATGYQACSVTQDAFQDCVCNGVTPGLDGGRDSSAGDADAGAPYLMPCGPSGACSGADAICFTFVNKGTLCTRRCAGPTDCPAPSPGCSNMGICKAP